MTVEHRAYDNEHGEPVVVIVATGDHDVSRLVNNLARGNCEQIGYADALARSLRRHYGGRSALALLKRHGGPDFTEFPASSVTDEEGAERRVSEQVAADAVWMAKLARGSSWPGEMAQRVDDAAARVLDALEER